MTRFGTGHNHLSRWWILCKINLWKKFKHVKWNLIIICFWLQPLVMLFQVSAAALVKVIPSANCYTSERSILIFKTLKLLRRNSYVPSCWKLIKIIYYYHSFPFAHLQPSKEKHGIFWFSTSLNNITTKLAFIKSFRAFCFLQIS